MKRFAIHTLLFGLLAAALTALGLVALGGTGRLPNVVYRPGGHDFCFTRLGEAGATHDVDVLFCGSSHAYRTFDPRHCAARGIEAFNLGTSCQTPLQTEALLDLYLDSLRPRLVVLEVHPDVMANDGVESALLLLPNMRPSVPLARMALRTRHLKVGCSAFYAAARNGLGSHMRHFSEPAADGDGRYVAGGYVEKLDPAYDPTPRSEAVAHPRPAQLAAMRRIVHRLDRRGIPFILLRVPGTEALAARQDAGDFDTRMAALGTYLAPRPDGLTDSLHFFDDDHLNQAGVDLYMPFILDSVIIPILNQP